MKGLEMDLNKEIYTINEIVELFPRCTRFIVINYRWKYKVGKNVNHKIYFTKKEVDKFIEETESENMKLRCELYNFIKNHPGLKDSNIYNHLNKKFTKNRTQNLLADISMQEYQDKYPGVYEDDESRLFVIGFEIKLNKKYDKKNGIFY